MWGQLWITVRVKKNTYSIDLVNKPHKENTNVALDEFEETLISIVLELENIVCKGDFNLNLLDRANKHTEKFLLILDSVNLYQIVDKPTRITQATATLFHYIIINESGVKKDFSHNIYSDHVFISYKLKINVSRNCKMVTYRSFRNFNEKRFIIAHFHKIFDK